MDGDRSFITAMAPYNGSPLLLHNTFLLLNAASDRTATIGFRCAWDEVPSGASG
jgi:hypothetical protein